MLVQTPPHNSAHSNAQIRKLDTRNLNSKSVAAKAPRTGSRFDHFNYKTHLGGNPQLFENVIIKAMSDYA